MMQEKVNLVNAIEQSIKQPALLLLLLHPLILYLTVVFNQKKNIEYTTKIINESKQLDRKINEIHRFIEDLREGASKFTFSQEFQNDRLIQSMINLRKELEISRKEEEQRKKEEQQRHWINEGLAKFGAILRENVEDLERLASQVTSNLVKYMNVQQAGFFVIKEEEGEKYIDMLALFAFDRKKFPDKRFAWGEGLIGACAIERKTIFIKEATDTFVDITSGLGGSNPKSILIVPIKDNNDKVHGVLELASFKIFQDFEIEFAEQVAESIGLTMASIETALTTQKLLRESQKQAEMLAQQEANMRKNIDDITQELEKSILENEGNIAKIKAFEEIGFFVEIDDEQKIQYINEFFIRSLDYENDKLIRNQSFSDFLTQNDRIIFEKTWKSVIENRSSADITLHFIKIDNKLIVAKGKLVPAYNEFEDLTNVYFVGYDYSEYYLTSKKLNHFLSENSLIGVMELDADGIIKKVNNKFLEILQKEAETIIDKKFFELFDENKHQEIINLINKANEGDVLITDQSININKEEKIHLLISFSAVKDINNEVKEYFIVSIDKTSEYEMQEKYKDLEIKHKEAEGKIERLILESEKKLDIFKTKLTAEFAQKEKLASTLNTFLDNLAKAIIIIEEKNIVLFNNFAEKIWGYKKEIVNGKKIEYLLPTDENYSTDENFLGNHLEKSATGIECFIVDRNNKKIKVLADIVKYEANGKNYTSLMLSKI